jgi:hypothetical protein
VGVIDEHGLRTAAPPPDLAAAHAMILAERATRIAAEAEARQLKAERHLLALGARIAPP